MGSRRVMLSLLSLCACSDPAAPVVELEDRPTPPIHTPRWAFTPWISKDISSGADTRDFVAGFRSRDIPVGAVVIDSPWETNYNTFIPHPERYPELGKMIADLRADEIRVVFWTTQMINDDSFDLEPGGDTYEGAASNYAAAFDKGYFVDDGARYFWWKGAGGGIDFFDKEAVRWWHRQQDPLLDLGVAGWKLDFGDSYVTTDPVLTAAGPVAHQLYSEEYYRDFWAYGVNRQGAEDFLTMVRPYDKSYQFEGRFFAKKEHCPVGWVGDNRRDFVGLEDALDHLFRSAEAGYVVIGSDVGGYLDRDDKDLLGPVLPFDVEVFARWTGVAALTPFMQLHGRANITPWTVPERVDESVAMYRYWATLHDQLVPFFYSLAEEAYAGGPTILRPIGTLAEWPGDYRFQVGDAFLVAPILSKAGARQVTLPSGARWLDWWDNTIYEGGTTITASMARDLSRIPLYVKEGAIVPAEVKNDATALGDDESKDHLTVLVAPSPADSAFALHEHDGSITRITQAANGTEITFTKLLSPTIVKILGPYESGAIDGVALTTVDTRPELTDGKIYKDQPRGETWIALPAKANRVTLSLTP